jgi:MFS family permease
MSTSISSNSRWLLLVLLNSLFIQAGIYVARPIVTYKALELGADAALVGVIGATFAIAPLFFAIRIGRSVDKGKDGLALFTGTAILLLVSVGLQWVNSIALLMVAMPLLGIGHLLVMVGGQTMISHRSGSSKYEKNFGLLTFYASLGHAVGPLVGGWLADTGGVQVNTSAAFWFATVLFIGGILAVLPLRANSTPSIEPKKTGQSKSEGQVRAVLAQPKFKAAIFSASATTSVVDVILIFLPLLGLQAGMTTSQIGILLAIRAAASMAIRGVLGAVSGRLGMRTTLVSGVAITLVACVLMVWVTDFWWLAAILAVSGLAMGIGQPLTMAWVSHIASPETRGLAIAIRLTANRFGQVVAPAVAGVIAVGGVSSVFWMLAGIQAVALFTSAQAEDSPK